MNVYKLKLAIFIPGLIKHEGTKHNDNFFIRNIAKCQCSQSFIGCRMGNFSHSFKRIVAEKNVPIKQKQLVFASHMCKIVANDLLIVWSTNGGTCNVTLS